jgi:hypothetical protein
VAGYTDSSMGGPNAGGSDGFIISADQVTGEIANP